MGSNPTRPKSRQSTIYHDLQTKRNFAGMMNFYHRCVPHLAELVKPIYAAMFNASKTLLWTTELQNEFCNSKTGLANATLLHHPRDQTPTALTTDASDTVIGAVLEQEFQGTWRPIAFFSKKLQPAETRYSVFSTENC